jgi:hypothetical protein
MQHPRNTGAAPPDLRTVHDLTERAIRTAMARGKRVAEVPMVINESGTPDGWRLITRRVRIDGTTWRATESAHAAARRQPPHSSAPVTTALRTVTRPRERRERHVARATSSADSGSDSDEPEPPPSGRLCDCGCRPAREIRVCACGCGRDITHKRADARTFGASCRQRLARVAQRGAYNPLEPEGCQCQNGWSYRDAEGDATCGLCGCWLAKVSTPVSAFHTFDALMRSNGTYVARRPVPREWRTARKEADPCPS